MKRAFAALGLLALAALTAAAAKPPARDPLIGAWGFKTAAYGPGCTLEGEMEIRQDEGAKLTCSFQARETCRPWTARARQTCTLTRAPSGEIAIHSSISAADSGSYRPDDFTVRMIRPDEMRGAMKSVYEAPVVFTRKVSLTS